MHCGILSDFLYKSYYDARIHKHQASDNVKRWLLIISVFKRMGKKREKNSVLLYGVVPTVCDS